MKYLISSLIIIINCYSSSLFFKTNFNNIEYKLKLLNCKEKTDNIPSCVSGTYTYFDLFIEVSLKKSIISNTFLSNVIYSDINSSISKIHFQNIDENIFPDLIFEKGPSGCSFKKIYFIIVSSKKIYEPTFSTNNDIDFSISSGQNIFNYISFKDNYLIHKTFPYYDYQFFYNLKSDTFILEKIIISLDKVLWKEKYNTDKRIIETAQKSKNMNVQVYCVLKNNELYEIK